jgi:glutaminyl-peptide cyclotransferase
MLNRHKTICPDMPDQLQVFRTHERRSSAALRLVIQTRFVALIVALGLVCGEARLAWSQDVVRLDAKRAMRYMEQITDLGSRISGSPGMTQQQSIIIKHFRQFGCGLMEQRFDVAHPITGRPVRMRNLIISWNPKAAKRVLLCCHYDTRPYPDRDKRDPRGLFVGANDGASGVALFMEMAHHMKLITPRYGVDMVFFDGEELVYRDSDKYFLGSEYFSKWYRNSPPKNYQYVCGVLVDMIAGKNLRLPMEKNSVRLAPRVTQSVWATARKLRVREFERRARYEVRDDHLSLNEIARIPTTDIIDFDYKHWHTRQDTAANCSGASMVKVGRVLMRWLVDVPID